MEKHYVEGEIEQTAGEEIANAVIHGVGFLLAAAALSVGVVFAARHCGAKVVTAMAVYGASMCVLYLSSTLYHALPAGSGGKRVFHVFDHSSIYLLIAGSYTPIVLGATPPAIGWTVFGIVWGLAVAGIVMKAFFTGRLKTLSNISYLAMGWMIVFALKPLWASIGGRGFALLAAGGVCYSVGWLFYMARSFRFAHAIWHLFVLAGSACHFFVVLLYVILAR